MCREKRRGLGLEGWWGGCHLGPVPNKCVFPVSSCPHIPPRGLVKYCISSVIESSIFFTASLAHSFKKHLFSIYHVLNSISDTSSCG